MGVDEMGLNTEHFTFDAGSKLAELWAYDQNIALLRTTRPMWESHKVSLEGGVLPNVRFLLSHLLI